MELGLIRDFSLYHAAIQLEKEQQNYDMAVKLSKLAGEEKEEIRAEKPAEKENSEEPDYEAEQAIKDLVRNIQIGNYSNYP